MCTETGIKHVYWGVQGACPRRAVTHAGGTAERSERRAVGMGLKLVGRTSGPQPGTFSAPSSYGVPHKLSMAGNYPEDVSDMSIYQHHPIAGASSRTYG